MKAWMGGPLASNSPLCRVKDLGPGVESSMFRLMGRYFRGADPAVFGRDLREKEWALLLRGPDGTLRGFSTLMRLKADGISALFSGDTIVDRPAWATAEFLPVVARGIWSAARRMRGPVYWFLICSGYRTYRSLPLFFRRFIPSPDAPGPSPLKRILDSLAERKFGGRYDPGTGIIRLAAPSPLREGISDPTGARLKDPHVAFFLARNPGHAAGDELACLAELSEENLTPIARRVLGL
ncbi:MAG: hypothetical protein WC728_05650 [Elusimicrobiota bacterium]